MIKRMKYTSRQLCDVGPDELSEIAKTSRRNNERDDLTGLLVKVGEYFFQILEGPPEAVDATYERIRLDRRHGDIVVVGSPELVDARLFGEWSMRVESLDPESEQRLEPIGHMLRTVVELVEKSVEMTAVLQRSLLRELKTRPSVAPPPDAS